MSVSPSRAELRRDRRRRRGLFLIAGLAVGATTAVLIGWTLSRGSAGEATARAVATTESVDTEPAEAGSAADVAAVSNAVDADDGEVVAEGAETEDAALEDADLEDADLEDADLEDAALEDADLEDADLEDAEPEPADTDSAATSKQPAESKDVATGYDRAPRRPSRGATTDEPDEEEVYEVELDEPRVDRRELISRARRAYERGDLGEARELLSAANDTDPSPAEARKLEDKMVALGRLKNLLGIARRSASRDPLVSLRAMEKALDEDEKLGGAGSQAIRRELANIAAEAARRFMADGDRQSAQEAARFAVRYGARKRVASVLQALER